MNIAFTGYAHTFSTDGNVAHYGAERTIGYLMLELRKRGHKCVIFTIKGCSFPGFDYVEVEKCWDDRQDIYYEAVKKYEQDTGTKFDMIHSFMPSGYLNPNFRQDYNFCLEPFMSFRPDHPSHWAENIISYSERTNQINGGHTTVIYLGLPEEFYEFSDTHDNYAVWCGRMDPGKCPHTAIEIAKRAGMKIILLGPSYHYPYFVDKVWPHIDQKNVIWFRGVNDHIKKKVLKKATILISPIWDNYHEYFGLVATEALACGTPIIAWSNTEYPSAWGIGEIFQHGQTGFLVNHSGYSDSERERCIQLSVDFIKKVDSINRKDCRKLFEEKFTSSITAEKSLKYYELVMQRKKVLNVTKEL